MELSGDSGLQNEKKRVTQVAELSLLLEVKSSRLFTFKFSS